LPHDDRLEGRKIAYVLYLSDLREEDGGSLDMYEDMKIVKSIIPKFGDLLLFEVSEKSFHQVAEVLTDANRLTIAGWFHA